MLPQKSVMNSPTGSAVLRTSRVHLDKIGEDVDGVGSRRQHADALLSRQAETVLGCAGQGHPRVGLLVGLGQHAPLGHIVRRRRTYLPVTGQFPGLQVVLEAGVLISSHGIDDATMPVGTPECWVELNGAGQVGDGRIKFADFRIS